MFYTIDRAKPGGEEIFAFIQTESWKAAFAENTRARGFYAAKGFVTYGREKPGVAPKEICYEREL